MLGDVHTESLAPGDSFLHLLYIYWYYNVFVVWCHWFAEGYENRDRFNDVWQGTYCSYFVFLASSDDDSCDAIRYLRVVNVFGGEATTHKDSEIRTVVMLCMAKERSQLRSVLQMIGASMF